MTSQNYNRPLWKEGMFLAPQHLQQAENYRDDVGVLMSHAATPFPWGIKLIDIDTNQLANSQFVLQRLEAITPSRDVVVFPGNIEIPSRSFEGVLSNPQQTAMVFLGIPDFLPAGANLRDSETRETEESLSCRFCARSIDVTDENTGISERSIEVRRIRGRILFEGEDLAGFQLLPLARIRPADNMSGAILYEQYVPPLMLISAWPRLQKLIENVAVRLSALQANLMRSIGSKRVVEWYADPRGAELILKAQAVNQVFFVFQQICREATQSPFAVFSEILRSIGLFWVFKGTEKVQKVPFYDHFSIGECFGVALEIMRTLIAALDVQSYVTRQFKPGKGHFEVDLEPDWIEKSMKLYVRVSGAGNYLDVVQSFVGVKVCAPSHFATALQRRVQALQLQWLRRPPSSFPVTDDGVYAEVVKSGPFWPGVEKEQALAIGAAEELPFRFDLFVE